MDTLEHNGTTYVKASILAKRHRYTTDYIGQLCRANKVDAQLVGRAWYVNEISLLGHKIERKKDTRPNEILSKNNTEISGVDESVEKVSIRPLLSKKTHRQFFSEELRPTISHNWENRAVAYTSDPSTLVPQVTNKIVKTLIEAVPAQKTVEIPIDLVESEKVIVKDVSQHNHREHLAFTELPEIPLEGTLAISDLDSAADYEDPEPVTLADLPDHAPVSEPEPALVVAKIMRYQKPVRQFTYSAPMHSKSHLVAASDVETPVVYSALTQAPVVSPLHISEPVAAQSATSRLKVLVLPALILLSVLVTGFSLEFSSVMTYDGTTIGESFSFHKTFLGEALLYLAN